MHVTALFNQVASFEALYAAALRAAAGKRRVLVPAAFLANLETEVLRLERQLRPAAWRPGRYVEIEVTDPSDGWCPPPRSATRWCTTRCTRSSPPGSSEASSTTATPTEPAGTHRVVARYERLRDRHRHVLRGDIYRYFPAIDHEVLKATFAAASPAG